MQELLAQQKTVFEHKRQEVETGKLMSAFFGHLNLM